MLSKVRYICPIGIRSIESYALRNYTYDTLVISSTLKRISLTIRPTSNNYRTFDNFTRNIIFRGKVSPYIASVSGEEQPGSFICKMNEDCTIKASDQAASDILRTCVRFKWNNLDDECFSEVDKGHFEMCLSKGLISEYFWEFSRCPYIKLETEYPF